MSTNAQTFVQRLEDHIIGEPIATENILEDTEIVEMVLADAEIEADRIKDLEKELEESPPALFTVTETYEALKEVVRFEEQLVDENFGIEKQHLLRNHYTTMIDILQY